MKNYHQRPDWSLGRVFYCREAFNGFGYHWRGVTPSYLWSFGKHYVKGKYVSDGRWDPTTFPSNAGQPSC